MNRLIRAAIRISSFLPREIAEILRQPRLIIGMVISPFLILLLVGIGYRETSPEMRTYFVAPESSPMSDLLQKYGGSLQEQVISQGVEADLTQALRSLLLGRADLVVKFPANPQEIVQRGQQAIVTFYHRDVDPIRVRYVGYLARAYIIGMNRLVVEELMQQGQQLSASYSQVLKEAESSAGDLQQALEQSDSASAAVALTKLRDQIGELKQLQPGAAADPAGGSSTGGSVPESIAAGVEILTTLVNGVDTNSPNMQGNLTRVSEIKDQLAKMDQELAQFQGVSPNLIVNPFTENMHNLASINPNMTDFFMAPVIALLLQHLAVTFGALSIVQDVRLGVMELIHVSPLSAGEMLVGKYLGHSFLAGIIAALLTVAAVFGLKTPMLGAWLDYVLVVSALIFFSLGIGFVLSLVSETDTQAVQYAMVVLLASVFFSGFIIRLEDIWGPLRNLSWIFPATHGIILLREVMLTGARIDPMALLRMLGFGFALLIASYWLLRRRIWRGGGIEH